MSYDPVLVVALTAWSIAVLGGMYLLWRYESTPGTPTAPPTQWPVESSMPRVSGQGVLIVFVHPHCPCSRSTLRELERLLVYHDGSHDVLVAFYRPQESTPGWEAGDLLETAARLPGVRVLTDVGGVEARRFGVSISGTAVAYDAAGVREFWGGITISRGHEGNSPGGLAVRDLLSGQSPSPQEACTYGCRLFAPESVPATTAARP